MDQEFTISTGMKIFYGVLALASFGFSLFLFSISKNPNVSSIVYLIPLMFIVTSILITINLFRRKVIISSDRVLCINVFYKKELATTDIKGYRIGEKVINLESYSPGNKITISNYIDLADNKYLLNWIKENFIDLDAIDLKIAEEHLLNDPRFGFTAEDREKALKKARTVANVYNVIGFIGGFGMIFLKNKYILMYCGLIYPLLGVAIMALSKGLIKFLSNKKRSVYSYTILGFCMPAFIMLFNSLDIHVLQYRNMWLPLFITSLILLAALYRFGINKEVESVKGQVIFMLILTVIYAFGGLIIINFNLDKSSPKEFHSVVIDQWTTSGKGSHYHIKLKPWLEDQQPQEIDISESKYQNISIGAPATILTKKGYLNIPWYVVIL